MDEKEFMERMKRAKEKVKDGILTPMVDMLPEDREYAAGVYVGVDIGSGDDVGVMEETTRRDMKLLKEMAWKLPVGLIWYIAAGFPFKHLPFWQGLIACFIFYLALDLIRWGLKREKEPTDTSAYRQHVYVFMADEDGELIMDAWVCNVPDIGEKIIIWNNGGFKHYILKHRIYGMNTDEKVGCWNLYVYEA